MMEEWPPTPLVAPSSWAPPGRWRRLSRRRGAAALHLLALATIAASARAQPIVEPELQVNSYDLALDQRAPAVAATSTGEWRVVWYSGRTGATHSQHFDRDGAPTDSDLVDYMQGDQPAIAVDGAGSFLTATHVCANPGLGVGDEILVGAVFAAQASSATTCGTALGHPVVAGSAGGGAVAAWEDRSAGKVMAQRFAADGSKLGDPFLVGTGDWPAIAMDAQGDFVIVWETTTLTSGSDIAGQRYDSNGNALGGTFQVNSNSVGDQYSPAVAMDAAGDFLVAWHSNSSLGDDTGTWSIQARAFDAGGSPANANDLQVNTYTPGNQFNPAVGADPDGNFLVAWESYGSQGTDNLNSSIQARRMSKTGLFSYDQQFQVNAYTTGYQLHPSVAGAGNDEFVVAWESSSSAGSDISGYSIHARRFGFVNRLVDGDVAETSSWLTTFALDPAVRVDLSSADWGPNGAPTCMEVGSTANNGATDTSASQVVPVVGGDLYLYSAWVRVPNLLPGNAAGIFVYWITPTGIVYPKVNETAFDNADPGGGWHFLQVTLRAPATAYAAQVIAGLGTVITGGSTESVGRFDQLFFGRAALWSDGFEPVALPWSASYPP